MKRRNLLLIAMALIVPIRLAWLASAPAGEAGPGLEIFNSDGTVDVYPPGQGAQQSPSTYTPSPGPAPAPMQAPAPAADPFYTPQTYSDPFGTAEPFPAGAPPFGAQTLPGPDPYDAPAGPPAHESPQAVLDSLDINNRRYHGLDGAVGQGNLPLACDIILQTLRERRIVNAALTKGPGGSLGAPAPHEVAFLSQMLSSANAAPETPLQAARRIAIVLDTFQQPVLDDYGYGAMFQQIILRLHADLTAIRMVLSNPPEDVVYHELAQTYIRVVTTCDFFSFPRDAFINDVGAVMSSAETMFYPDGSSIGGDVGGITGAPLKNLLMLDEYSFGNDWLRRRIASGWRILAKPARFLQGVMLPDMTLPRFGPRGERELNQVDMAKLKIIFPEERPANSLAGLTATSSFPYQSGTRSYGGIFASRSDSGPGARYLAVRYGPWGQLPGAPAHNDFGSLVVANRNVRFIADSGGFGDRAAEAAAHSVLSLGGGFAEPTAYNTPGEPVDSLWRTNAAIDYASDAVSLPDGKIWQRGILYVKSLPGEGGSDFWLILDQMDMRGDNNPYPARIRYQIEPGVQAYHDGSGMLLTTNFGDGPAMRIFAIDEGSQLTLAEGDMGAMPSYLYDNAGNAIPAPSVVLERTLVGNTTTASILYPSENSSLKPLRIERDSDIIRGRTGAIVIDHGQDKIDVVAWAPPGHELVTPTLNLQLSADMAVFRLRKGKIVRAAFVNLEHFQAKEPDGGEWSMRVRGNPATLFLEPDRYGGWQVLSDHANDKAMWLEKVNLGPAITDRRMRFAPGDLRTFAR